ncbi:MAG: EAL domain-containing protein [Zoogloea sp.]|nr:EAL domain-containing protein [Zoogloea sp.]
MKAIVHHRYSRYSYALAAAIVAVVVLFLQNRSVDIELHGRRMEMLSELRRLDAQLDRDVLRVSSFTLDQFDPLVETTTQLRELASTMRTTEGGFAAGTDPAVQAALEPALAVIEEKLRYLERIKSHTALLRNGLQYLPETVDELAPINGKLAHQLSRQLNHLYLYNLFPSGSDLESLHTELEHLSAEVAQRKSAPLATNALIHMRAHLDRLSTLVELRQRYNDIPAAQRFDALNNAYSSYYTGRSLRSERTSIALLVATVLLFGLLGVALRRLGAAHAQADQAWRKLRDAVESLSEAFALFDANGRLVLHNAKYLEFYPWLAGKLRQGIPLEEIDALNRGADALEPASAQEVQDLTPTTASQGARSYLQRLVDGRWYLASDSRTSNGDTACVRVDVTESKQRELDLRKLSRALAQSPASVVITDTSGTIEYVNPKFIEITGYTAEEVLGQNPRVLKSGSRPSSEYRKMWQTITAGQEWRGLFLNRRKDGSLFWESASISPLRDDNGQITHFIAVKEDITERKRAEDEMRLHATVFDTATEGIIVTDAENRIKTVNTAFTRITGYSRNEAVGLNPSFLHSGRHDRAFYEKMWLTLQHDGNWAGEIWNRRSDGTVYPEWLSIAAIKNEQGEIQEFVGIFSDVTQRKQDEERIQRQANYDALTELPNRSLLQDRLAQAISTARRNSTQVAVLFMDLDRFKAVNDTFGHVVGDQLLCLVSRRLRDGLRQQDTVARFGGDEFVIMLPDVHGSNHVAAVAEKLIASVSEPFLLVERELFVGASVGVALYPDDAEDADTLLRNADMAMYQAKESGRSCCRFYTTAMNESTQARLELERSMRQALERGEFVLEYQPVFSCAGGRMESVEALLRWQHPQLGMVYPDHFIGLAEESGLIAPIGLWVLQTACHQTAAWRRDHPQLADLRVAVNLSSRQWQLGLEPEAIAAVLEESGLPASALVLEITESLVLEGTDDAITWLHRIRALGVELAVDDFGTGYSSLSYLKRFPVGELKIDRSFVRDLPEDAGSASLVRAILSMAASLGLNVVAEGVETAAQYQFLQHAGCGFIQGYLLGRPLRPERIPEVGSGHPEDGHDEQHARLLETLPTPD